MDETLSTIFLQLYHVFLDEYLNLTALEECGLQPQTVAYIILRDALRESRKTLLEQVF